MSYPPHIQDMVDDFAFMDDWEDRYSHLIDLGKDLAPLNPDERNDHPRKRVRKSGLAYSRRRR